MGDDFVQQFRGRGLRIAVPFPGRSNLSTALAAWLTASYADKQPPPFGHQLLEYFQFDPGYINLNNGLLVLDRDPYLTDNR